MKTCKICGCEIPIWNITNACKSCFNRFRKKDKFGNWMVEK